MEWVELRIKYSHFSRSRSYSLVFGFILRILHSGDYHIGCINFVSNCVSELWNSWSYLL